MLDQKDKNCDDSLNNSLLNLDTDEPTEMRIVWEGFTFDKEKENDNDNE